MAASEERIGRLAPASDITPYRENPLLAGLLDRPNTVCREYPSLIPKPSGEDSFFSGPLQASGTLSHAFYFYHEPPIDASLEEIYILFTIGDNLDGHPGVLHGGVIAALTDECFGTFKVLDVTLEKIFEARRAGLDENKAQATQNFFTVDLRIRYLRQVRTPGQVLIVVKRANREGRKDWLTAEFKQWQQDPKGGGGKEVLCAAGEAVFVTARRTKLA